MCESAHKDRLCFICSTSHAYIIIHTRTPPHVVHFVSAEDSLKATSSLETKFNASSQRTEGMIEDHKGIVKDVVINKSWVMGPMNECSRFI